jgi:DNA polymerase-1
MIAHYLINPDMRHNMDILSETYLKYSPQSIEALIGKKKTKKSRDVELEEIKEYAEDADVTLQLKEIFTLELDKRNQETFEEIEIPLVKVLADMEKEGIRVDVDFLKSMSKTLMKTLKY